MNAHTPGEWFINQYTNWVGFSIHAKDRGCIAERWYDKEQAQPYGSEIMANAKLIAAAPDLLAALERMIESHVAMVASGDCGNWDAEKDEEIIQARAAIAKAIL